MIYLFTGTPGAGKTLNAIKETCEDNVFSNRPIYYNNVRCLALDIDFLNSFEGFFYTQYLRTCSKEDREFLKDTMALAHKEKRLVSMQEVPFLGREYNEYDWIENFEYWINRLYPKKRIKSCLAFIELCRKKNHKIRVKQLRRFNLDWRKLEDPCEWYKLPYGSVIFIDEVQDFFGKRSASAKAPIYVSEFNTHRHKGFDLRLITQDSSLLDYQLKACINQHIHYKNLHGGSKVSRIEKGGHFNTNSVSEKKSADRRKVIQRDKKFYGSYFSAEIHTNKYRIPTQYIYAAVLIPALILIAAFGAYKFSQLDFISKSNNSKIIKEINIDDNNNEYKKVDSKKCVNLSSGKQYCI
ncbi:hypothetical protein AB0537_001260 [Vibrio parahaemolyticus]|nr:hypothetical protein IC830_07190 [Vibrio parahaemolyticus]